MDSCTFFFFKSPYESGFKLILVTDLKQLSFVGEKIGPSGGVTVRSLKKKKILIHHIVCFLFILKTDLISIFSFFFTFSN